MASLVFKDKNGAVGFISGKYYDRVNNFFVELSVSDSYPISHNQNDSMYFTIDAAVNGNINTFRQYKVNIGDVLLGSNSSGNINVVKSIPVISDIVTGLSPANEKQLQTFSNYSINRNIFEYDLPTGADVIAKIYITLNNIKYTAVCPPFLYKHIVPTLTQFQIQQNQSSSALEITGLNVNDVNSFIYFPKQISILGEVIQQDNSLDSDVTLGSIVVNDNNEYISDLSSMVALYSNGGVIEDGDVIPLSTNRYKIDTQPDLSSGVLYNKTNADIIVHAIANSKETVEINYNSTSTNMLYLRAPVSISNVIPYDAIISEGSSDNNSMTIMDVFIDSDWAGYAPTSLVFKLTTINNNIAPNAVWTFSTDTINPILYNTDGVYSITYDQMKYVGTSDATDTAASHPLDNNPSSYQLTVTAFWGSINSSRATTYNTAVVFTQNFPTVLNVTAYNTWQLLSIFGSNTIDSNDIVMPRAAYTLRVLKNNLFNGNNPGSLDDPSKTQFQIQYIRSLNLDSNGDGNWINVPSGYITQPSDTLTGNSLLYNGALSAVTGYYDISPNSKAGGLFNVPELAGYNIGKVGSQQNPLFIYLANIDDIYNESAGNPLLFRVKIISSVDGYAIPSSEFLSINKPIYTINKPLIYSFFQGSNLEPYMSFSNTPNTLVIPMLVGSNDVTNIQSIYYSKGLVQWVKNSALTLPITQYAYGQNPQFTVDLGTIVEYNVTYEYDDPNIIGGHLIGKISNNYQVKCQGLPGVSSDFTVSNDSIYYVYDNALDADSLRFSLSMVNDSTSDTPNTNRIDGVSLFIKDHQNNVLNNGNPISIFYNYNASGIVKYTPGSQTVSLSSLNLTRGNSYSLEFIAFRDPLTESKGGVVFSPIIADHYTPPPFIYLETNVRDTPILYSWGTDDISAQPYMDFATGNLVIPLDIGQTPNYYGAYVNWYKNHALNIDVANDQDPVPFVSALQGGSVDLPEFHVTYGTVVIYTVTYVYLSLDGTTQISGTESSRRSLSAQGMPAIRDFTQSPAENPNAIAPAPVVQYIQDNTFNTLVFKLDTVNTSNPVILTHRIDGVILFVTNDTGNQQYVAIFPNALIESLGGDCVVGNFTGSAYLLTPGNTYTLTFSAYRDARVLTSDVFFENGLPSKYLAISETVTSTVDFVFLASPIAPIFDDQTIAPNVISAKDVISHSSSGPADQYTIKWPHSIINDVTNYLLYRVTAATESVPESRILEAIVPANPFLSPDVYEYKYDIPPTSQNVIYDIQKFYNGRLSASTRISFPTGKLIPASLTIVKQDLTHILAELTEAVVDITMEQILLDIMVNTSNGSDFPFLSTDGKKNPNGKLNTLIIQGLNQLGQALILQQKYRILWSLSVNGNITQTNLDTSYGPPATFVYATRPSVSLYYSDINANMVMLQGKPALKLRLNANMGLGVDGYITPTLTNLVVVLSQDTSTVFQNVKVDGVENLLMFNNPNGLQRNTVYNAASDYSNSSLNLLISDYSNNVNTTFQLHTGNLTLGDESYLVFPTIDNGYISNTGVDFMIIASNNYGIDSYVNSFVFLNSPTFTQNGVTITDGSFVLESTDDMSDQSFTPNYPTSNSPGVISYSSSNPLVATVIASSGEITIVGTGSTDIIMSQAASVNYLSSSIKATYSVLVPELFYYTDLNYGFDQGASFQLTPPSSPSLGAFTYTVIGNPDIVSIVGSSAVMLKTGTTTIRVTQAAYSQYRSASIDVDLTLTPIVNDWGFVGDTIYDNDGGYTFGSRLALSRDGGTYMVGSIHNVYRSDPSKIIEQMNETLPNYGAVGHIRLGARVTGAGGSGYIVALSQDGSTAVYADPMSSLNGINAGSIWVYNYNSVTDVWVLKGSRLYGTARQAFLGTSVSISSDGTKVAFSGAGGEFRKGTIRVCEYDPAMANWVQTGLDIVGSNNNEMLGDVINLSSDGDTIAASSYYSGLVKVFKRNPLTQVGWELKGNIITVNRTIGWFGCAMDMNHSGNIIAVAEPRTDNGITRIYKHNSTSNLWEILGTIEDPTSGWSGNSVSISDDGYTVAIGTPNSSDGSGGVTETGKVRVFRYIPNKTVSQPNRNLPNYDPVGWSKVGVDILGKEKFSKFGEAVSISGDGKRIIVGAPGILQRQGYVQIYEWGQVSTFGQFNIHPELKVYKNQPITKVLIPPSTNANGTFSFTSSDTNVAEITSNNNLWYLTVKMSGYSKITAIQAASPTFIRSTVSADLVVMAIYPNLGEFILPEDLIYSQNSSITRTLTPPTSNSQGEFTFTSSNLAVATIQNINGVHSINIVGSGNTKITAIQAASGIYASASASHLLNTATGDISGFRLIDDSDFVALATDFTDSGMTLQRSGDMGTGLIRKNENFYSPYKFYFNGSYNNYYVFTHDGTFIFDSNGLYSSPDGDFDSGTSSQVPIKKFSFFGCDLVSDVRSKLIQNDTLLLVKVNANKFSEPSKTAEVRMIIDRRGGMKINYTISSSFNADGVTIGYSGSNPNSTNDDLFLDLNGVTYNDTYTNVYQTLNGKTVAYNIDNTQLVRSGLLAHYDASNLQSLTISQFYATRMNDISGNGHHLTLRDGPGPMLSNINNVQALNFSTGTYISQALVPMSTTAIIFMVTNYSSDIRYWGSFFHHGLRDTNFNFRRNSVSATNHNLDFAVSANGLAELPMTTGRSYILVGLISGDKVKLMTYSLEESLRSTNQYNTNSPLIPGNKLLYVARSDRTDYYEFCNSIIGEIIYYSQPLSDHDIATNIKYLRHKWFMHTLSPYP